MPNTPRLGLRLLEATDVANYELINQLLLKIDELVATINSMNQHKHDGTAGNGPKIAYSALTGAPASLPANGGNADTVDNKHAADFAAAQHPHADATTSVAGFLSTADKGRLDTLNSRVNQALTTTSSPTFKNVTAEKVTGAVYA